MKSNVGNPNNYNGGNKKMILKNKKRLGGGVGGLSLDAFANAKSMNDGYNPAIIKKRREFYKNAKYVSKYKKIQKQPNQGESSSQATKLIEDGSQNREGGKTRQWKQKQGKKTEYSLDAIYNKKREEEEKARMEKEAILKAKKEEKEISEARRKARRENMFKRTRSGQPIMKYRIEHLLQTITGSKD
uniref:rRNA-processing protein FYV7 n=1 Tax=Erigeron canadensis TaxID=72917 RepID=UPI001CB92CA5|nr:rRNA-processing protein FYV7 [Erigeron canadensis]